jgi:Raf kinase inhibitor-like YbhB/YbcL family protein
LVAVGFLAAISWCQVVARSAYASAGRHGPVAQEPTTRKAGETVMKITLESPAFAPGKPIPRKYTGEGEDVSPPLKWVGVPKEAKELALICDDPDAPRPEPWVHWVIYKLPANLTELPENVPKQASPARPSGALQGKNSWGRIGYGGPMPPPGHGVHHYHFKLYALDAVLDLAPGLTKDDLLKKIRPHIIAEGELIGTYQR